ncbi:hypothetical protein GCM10010483_26550 [Actinokineospora diospyrosa]
MDANLPVREELPALQQEIRMHAAVWRISDTIRMAALLLRECGHPDDAWVLCAAEVVSFDPSSDLPWPCWNCCTARTSGPSRTARYSSRAYRTTWAESQDPGRG